MTIFTRAVVALWASVGLGFMTIVLLLGPPTDWALMFSEFGALMLRLGAVAGVIWLIGWLFAWSGGAVGRLAKSRAGQLGTFSVPPLLLGLCRAPEIPRLCREATRRCDEVRRSGRSLHDG
jgi:hypothetical protein